MQEIHNPTSHVIVNINNAESTTNTQAQIACMKFLLFSKIMTVLGLLCKAKGESGIAAAQSGFNSASETALAGGLVAGGGLVLGAAGGLSGIGACKNAQGVAEATENRNDMLLHIRENALPEDVIEDLPKNSDLTIQVEALDEPELDSDLAIQAEALDDQAASLENDILDAEEEIFYDAEETLSNKQTQSEEPNKEEQVKKTEAQGKFTDQQVETAVEHADKNYDVEIKLAMAEAGKLQGLAAPGQGIQIAAQGLSDFKRSESQKEGTLQQVQQEIQNQEAETARNVKATADELTRFNPFDRNSSSLRG